MKNDIRKFDFFHLVKIGHLDENLVIICWFSEYTIDNIFGDCVHQYSEGVDGRTATGQETF